MQNKKRNKKRGQATFSGWAAPFIRKEEKAGEKTGTVPIFPKSKACIRMIGQNMIKKQPVPFITHY